jgi:hypothetical protein
MNKDDLKVKLRNSYAAVLKEIENCNAEEFYCNKNSKWSAAQNLSHLTLSAKLFSRALYAPKFGLLYKFGIHVGNQKTLGDIDRAYKSFSFPATTGFEPKMAPETSLAYEIEMFKSYHEKIISGLDSWSIWQLKLLRVPQLVFGHLSILEMCLFFTYHLAHHQKAIKVALA